jgi:hypothetical protein
VGTRRSGVTTRGEAIADGTVGRDSVCPGAVVRTATGRPCGGCGNRQETAAFTSSVTFCSTAGVHFCSANDTGHRSPSSRFAASWNSSVEYRVLNLPEFLKQKTTGAPR